MVNIMWYIMIIILSLKYEHTNNSDYNNENPAVLGRFCTNMSKIGNFRMIFAIHVVAWKLATCVCRRMNGLNYALVVVQGDFALIWIPFIL